MVVVVVVVGEAAMLGGGSAGGFFSSRRSTAEAQLCGLRLACEREVERTSAWRSIMIPAGKIWVSARNRTCQENRREPRAQIRCDSLGTPPLILHSADGTVGEKAAQESHQQ